MSEGRGELDADLLWRHYRDVVKKTWNFSGRLQTEKDHYLNAAMGLAGEAGEVLDEFKKTFFHSSRSLHGEKERATRKLEYGDVIYYLLQGMALDGFSFDEVCRANKEKLAARHPELGLVKERNERAEGGVEVVESEGSDRE